MSKHAACCAAALSVLAASAVEAGEEAPGVRGTVRLAEEPAGVITLDDALAAALERSPELAGWSWEVRAREADALQARVRPNPELGAELENWGGTGETGGLGALETTVTLSQRLELGGKRARREALAESERDLADREYEAARADVLAETARAFIEVLHAQEELASRREFVALAEEVLAFVARRVEAGAASPVEESRARVELGTSRIDLERVARELAAARQRLAALWAGETPRFEKAAGSLEAGDEPPPSLEELRSRIGANPDLARRESELERRRAAVALERAAGAPDLTAGAGVRWFHEPGDAAFLVELGVPLPLFDRNRGASRAAELRLHRAEEERRAARARVSSELTGAHASLHAAWEEATALRERILPEAEKAFRAAEDGYQRGLLRLTDVLDTKRTLADLRSRRFAALARYHTALTEIERLTGERP